MSKRPLPSGPTTPRKRRVEDGKNQSKLDHFFKSSLSPTSKRPTGPQIPPTGSSPELPTVRVDGADTRNPELWDQVVLADRPPVATSKFPHPDVIDVDLLDDYEHPIAGPSTVSTTNSKADHQGLVSTGGSGFSGCSPTPSTPARPVLGSIAARLSDELVGFLNMRQRRRVGRVLPGAQVSRLDAGQPGQRLVGPVGDVEEADALGGVQRELVLLGHPPTRVCLGRLDEAETLLRGRGRGLRELARRGEESEGSLGEHDAGYEETVRCCKYA